MRASARIQYGGESRICRRVGALRLSEENEDVSVAHFSLQVSREDEIFLVWHW